jgi:hypothetical protein
MKVIVFVKATPNSEKGVMPSEQLLADMTRFNEELVKAGIMQGGDGLKPSAQGKRVRFADGKIGVTDGPFAETKELVAGFWIWNVKSMDEALAWAKRCPHPMPGEEAVLEIRPVYELADFGDAVTPEIAAREEKMRQQIEGRPQ